MARGEISPDVDLEIIGPALAGILLHRSFVMGLAPDDDTVRRVVDHVILPAVGYRRTPEPATTSRQEADLMTDIAESIAPDGTEPATSGASRHLGAALVLICVAQLMVVLDSTIANIALPFIQKDLSVSQANLQWIVTGYALAFGGLLLLGGRLGDLYGRRRVFMIGVAIFAVASGVGGLAQNELMLLGSRGLQGLGAAIASPTALALITTTFPAGPQRNRAFSVYAAMSGAGAAVGLILGGWLTGLTPDIFGAHIDGWRLTFLINVPIGLAAAYFAPRVLAESESHPGELDLPGAVTGTLGLVGLVYGLSRAGDQRYGWGDPWTIASLVVGVGLLAFFVFMERRIEHPLLPFRILASRTRGTAFVAMMIVPAAMFAMFFFLSLFVQNVMGYSPLRTGVAFLPFSFGIVFGATLSSKLMVEDRPALVHRRDRHDPGRHRAVHVLPDHRRRLHRQPAPARRATAAVTSARR